MSRHPGFVGNCSETARKSRSCCRTVGTSADPLDEHDSASLRNYSCKACQDRQE